MKRINLLNFVTVLAVVSLFACTSKKEETTTEEKAIPVKVKNVKAEMVPQNNSFTATIEPYKVNHIGSSTPNRIKKIFVEVGDRVKAGQTLVQMDNATLSQQKAQLDNLHTDYNRTKELFAVGGASQQQVDQIRTQYETAKAAYDNQMENTTLVSPISGVITARNYDNGDMYAQTPIVTVMQIQPVKVLINVSEQHFKDIKNNMPVDVKVDVYDDEIFKGKVSLIHPTIDPDSRTFTVEVSIPNNDNRVRPGMFARVNINFGDQMSILVPDMAVIKQAGSNDKFVFTVENGMAHYKKVELGQRLNGVYEIIGGLKDGDVVVISGQTKLNDQTKVDIKE